MTAVTAPTAPASATVASIAQPGSGNAANSALANNEGFPADFASALRALQRIAGQVDAALADPASTELELGGKLAAVLGELDSKTDKQMLEKDVGPAIDIAALLGQINPGALSTPIPTKAAEPVAPGLAAIDQSQTANTRFGDLSALQSGKAGVADDGLKSDDAALTAEAQLLDSALESHQTLSASATQSVRNNNSGGMRLEVATPVHSPNWSADVGQRIVWMARNDIQEAQLSVNPPHLGPIEISLSLKDDNATARFFSPHPEIRDLLEQALPKLKEMLAGTGVQLGQSDVGEQARQAFEQFAESRNGNRQGQPSFSEEHPSLQAQNAVNQAVIVRSTAGNGLVDTFV